MTDEISSTVFYRFVGENGIVAGPVKTFQVIIPIDRNITEFLRKLKS